MKPLLLVAILLLCTILPSSAMSDEDKQIIRATILLTLGGENEFSYLDSEVGRDNSLNIWYLTKETDRDTMLQSLAKIVGVYWGIAKSYPDISDLNINIGTKEYIGGTAYCTRDWIGELKPGPDGGIDHLEAGLLVLKVLGTFEEV